MLSYYLYHVLSLSTKDAKMIKKKKKKKKSGIILKKKNGASQKKRIERRPRYIRRVDLQFSSKVVPSLDTLLTKNHPVKILTSSRYELYISLHLKTLVSG